MKRMFRILIYVLQDSRVKLSVWRVKDKGSMMIIRGCAEEHYFLMLREYARNTSRQLYFVKMLKVWLFMIGDELCK